MKKVFLLVLLVVGAYSCTNNRPYELIGAQGRKPYYPEVPIGMVYIPAGGFNMGMHDEAMFKFDDAREKTVTVSAFYMDQTEISNNEYRQFVEWVRDSIGLERLVDRGLRDEMDKYINFDQDILFSIEDDGSDIELNNYYNDKKFTSYKELTSEVMDPLQGKPDLGDEYVLPETFEKDARIIYNKLFEGYTDAQKTIVENTRDEKKFGVKNYDAKTLKKDWLSLNWQSDESFNMWENQELMPLLSDMYYPKKERFYNRREIDYRNLVFEYFWIDFKEASKKGEIAYYDAPGTYEFSDQPQDASKRLNDRDGALLYQRVGDENNRSTYDPKTSRQPISIVNADGSFNQLNDTLNSPNLDSKANNPTLIGDPDNKAQRDGFISGKDLDMGWMNRKMEWNAYRGHSDRSRFIIHEKIPVYPDTLCWVSDYTYSNADKIMTRYFSHPAYDNYPVVGVTWKQAKAFSVWRTQLLNSYLISEGEIYVNDFRLPSEAEWERAARGDLNLNMYPWGGPYIRNAAGCFLGNFKPMRGRYFEDGGVYTVKVYSYNPNNFGLFCMAGNVSEWCESAYDEDSYLFMHDMNPEYSYDAKKWEPPVMKRKVIRGGSWKDVGHYLNVGARSFEYQDTAKSYIGFRNVMSHLGRGGKDITKEGGEEIQSDINLR